ncbi:autotransporter outer membrane beta-barrel domain-containing protein [Klebsiella aerogenes]|uniref:autotransporter outer membrane beta-barrel domain-containing protein n=1 Tax=Klebsiella aerogenes TaxID=548 RepID=UPI0028E0274B|nr:autotransporter outer membrane beta-barrel domain-containing protein [Klebsiella aerogenes]MDT8880975.1 autotransporter outer membrane beta-barrel domain-containing protein [Klebsiella aerogenes]
MFLIKNTNITVTVTGDGAQSHGLLVNASPTEKIGETSTIVQNSSINSEGDGAYLVGGYSQFENSKIKSTGSYGIVTKGGVIYLDRSNIEALNDSLGLYLKKGYDGTYVDNSVTLDNSSITTERRAAIVVGTDATAHLFVNNKSKIVGGDNTLLIAKDNSVVGMEFNNSTGLGNLEALGNATVDADLANGSSLYGSSKNVNHISLDSTSSWEVLGNSDVNALTNAGLVTLSGANNSDTTLTIHNDYKGDNGTIVFHSQLGGDNSPTDKLVIDGNSEGKTNVVVKNVGGKGSNTLEGIELIFVGGKSEGIFNQSGRIVAGAYDYSLIKKGNNWYLVSTSNNPIDPTDPKYPIDPKDPIDPTDPKYPIDPIDPIVPPVTPPGGDVHTNRPEGGSYIANLTAANTLFNTSLHDRLGETEYIDALTGEPMVTSLWLRQVGGHNNWRDSSGQLKTQSNSYVVQLGGDVTQWSTDGLNRGHIGLMAGYANSHSTTHSSVTNYKSKGSLNGYSIGAYGTWFANDEAENGLYVDSWIQYNWFNNKVNGQELASESYKSKGLTASVESGFTFKMGEFSGSKGTKNEWYIQPQAQATWMAVKADEHREENGSYVNTDGNDNLQTRLGMRAYLKSHHAMKDINKSSFEPFIEANWLHNTQNYSVKMDDVRISQAGARNIGEIKLGCEGKINSRLNLWGNIGTQVGDKGYNNHTATLGVKYTF